MGHRITILVMCQSLIPSAMVGVVKPLEFLKKRGIINFSFNESHKVTKKHLVESDIIICVRGCAHYEVDIVKAAKERGRYIIYFLDDDLLNVPRIAKSYDYYSSFNIKKNIINLLKLSDVIMTPNKNIARKYNCYCSDARVSCVPALLLDENKDAPYSKKDEEEQIVIGFSGGIDHERSLKYYLMNPIEKIIDEFGKKVKFEVMGPKPDFLDRLKITYVPYEIDYSKYVNKMKSLKWDIGLAPLQKSDFHSCKFYNKYLEYGSIGAAGIYSEVEPYTQVVNNGINGLLVGDSSGTWVEAMRMLIMNRSKRLTISNNAYNHIKENFCLSAVANQIEHMVPEFGAYQAPIAKENDFKINYVKNPYLRKVITIWKNFGYKAPLQVFKKIMINIKTGA